MSNFGRNNFSASVADPDSAPNRELHKSHVARQKEQVSDIIQGNIPVPPKVVHPNIAELYRHHFDKKKTEPYTMPHAIWTEEECRNVEITHTPPVRIPDYLAYLSVQALRLSWDLSTGYLLGKKLGLIKFGYHNWLLRIVYLETVAGVPGMMFGMVRHLHALRRMRRDYGWIHTLLAEAENERMHLLTFLKLYEPGKAFRYCVVGAQFIMSNYLFLAYVLSPRYCHKFVGYLEEEAVKTYTTLLNDIDNGALPELEKQCSRIARDYWQLKENATWRDVMAQVRADEANHRDVNHALAPLASEPEAPNPFRTHH
jgi:hypothetical protein